MDIIGGEEIASELDEDGAEGLRHEAKKILKKIKHSSRNLEEEKLRAFRSLKEKREQIINDS